MTTFTEAAERIVAATLRSDGSLFTPGAAIWTAEHIADLHTRFVQQPDTGSDSFDEKFKRQLGGEYQTPPNPAPPAVYQLAAELLYIHLLPANGINASTKRGIIAQILEWSPAPVAIPADLDRALEHGVAKASQFFLIGRPKQLWFLLNVYQLWKQLPAEQQTAALADPWRFQALLGQVPIGSAFAQRALLLHIVHPASFEPIMSPEHKRQIAVTFGEPGSAEDIDRQLLAIRAKLTPIHGVGFRFYQPEIAEQWQQSDPGDDPDIPETDEPIDPETQILVTSLVDILRGHKRFRFNFPFLERYVMWIAETFGKAIELVRAEDSLDVYFQQQLVQSIRFNQRWGPYLLLRDGVAWPIETLRLRLRRPRSLKRREPYGWRCIITNEADQQLLEEITMAALIPTAASQLPRTLGAQLRPYAALVSHLNEPRYTPQAIVDRIGRIVPPIAQLSAAPDVQQLVDDLLHLRLLEPLGDGSYRRWEHLSDGSIELLLRYAALTLLAGDGEALTLPILDVPLDRAAPAAAWPLGETLLAWYAEAGIAQETAPGVWQLTSGALEPGAATGPTTARAIHTFLTNLASVRANTNTLPALGDAPLQALPPALLEARIGQIQRELLVDADVIRRIYRSLLAGHHVILSGPPGTGKTHLARILPRLLWADAQDTVTRTMPTALESSPLDPPGELRKRREGYLTEVVTATEDWGVRHVIGGIAPRLQREGDRTSLVYGITLGCVSRAALANYRQHAEPLRAEDLVRHAPEDSDGTSYKGVWLVIDEFTRAQIDVAFGGLLTTLGGQSGATLAVPTDDGEIALPLPRDFRLIGTLNSYDRHFLNQISEAMKRRFSFIDVLPPARDQSDAELALAAASAIARLAENGLTGMRASGDGASWDGVLTAQRGSGAGVAAYTLSFERDAAESAVRAAWRIFQAARVYRQLGTAQGVALLAEVLAGAAVGMTWTAALDSALADVLADQLQLLQRDELRVLRALLTYPHDAAALANAIESELANLPEGRKQSHRAALEANGGGTNLAASFGPPTELGIGQEGLFGRRLRSFIADRGL